MMRYSRGVVLVLARHRIEKMPQRPLAIVGMDAVDPVLMGLVDRVRRQAVDDQIFRRAAVA